MNTNVFMRLMALFMALAILPGCSNNPATGGPSVVVMTQGKETSIGKEMYDKMMAEGAAYDDPELQAYVRRIGQRLVDNSDQPDTAFTFTVIDSPDINAFATPGGFIYVNRGLMAYLDNEDELAGVMAHEIGHVTARHAARQQTANITNQVLATTAYILTGSGDLAEASNMYGTELLRGYGRDHELEADGLGAEYMHKAGYDTDALLEVIGVLKDQEQFQRVRAKSSGKPSGTYHGLYATHPRNDQRLKTVIGKASELDEGEQAEDPAVPGEFRRQIQGLAWGASSQRAKDRYFHNKLGFSFAHPEGWTVQTGASAIVATAPDGSASVTVGIQKLDPAQTPRQVLESGASGTLSIGKELDQAGLKGYTAVASNGSESRRLAAVDFNRLTYRFEGEARDFAAADTELLSIIESFRPMAPRERQTSKPRTLHYIQVPRGATIATLAASLRIPDAEAQLRLINGLYPGGEPRTGDWIKMIR